MPGTKYFVTTASNIELYNYNYLTQLESYNKINIRSVIKLTIYCQTFFLMATCVIVNNLPGKYLNSVQSKLN